MDYYTYAWMREDGTPYYIGKGKNDRAFRKGSPDPDRVLILKNNLSEFDAYKHEMYMISVLGRKDLGTGILINLTNGGEGFSGFVFTEEVKQKMRKPKSEDHKQATSDASKKLWEDPKFREKCLSARVKSQQTDEYKEKQRVAQINRDPSCVWKMAKKKRKNWRKEVWDLIEEAINSTPGYLWGMTRIHRETGATKASIRAMAALVRKGITWEQAMSGQS